MTRQRNDPTDGGGPVSVVVGTVPLQTPAVLEQPSLDPAGPFLNVHILTHSVGIGQALSCYAYTFPERSREAVPWTQHGALRDEIARRDEKPHSRIGEVKTEVHGISLRDSTLRHQWRALEGLSRRPCAVPSVPRRDGLPSRGPDAPPQALVRDAAGRAVCEPEPAGQRQAVNGSLGEQGSFATGPISGGQSSSCLFCPPPGGRGALIVTQRRVADVPRDQRGQR